MINLQLFCRRKFYSKKVAPSNQISVAVGMDLPSKIDSHTEVIITGIESEEVEEINDAYKDILEELGG